MDVETMIKKIRRSTVEILSEEELKRKLLSGRKLRIKAGFDPTMPDLHLGHFVLLKKLKEFQDMGHEVIFLIGDYTATIGDPSGRSEKRNMLSLEKVKENAKTYQEQVWKILDPKKTTVVYNSTWLKDLSLKEVLRLTSFYTVARMLERDDFSMRYQEGKAISIVEFLYPLLQAYDSVVLKADIEIGGVDQKFNFALTRDIQKSYGQEPEVVIMLPLLIGLDGKKKMSKTYHNYISLQEEPLEMYGKLMKISDDLMWHYYEILSDTPLEEIERRKKELHPKESKKLLAKEILSYFFSEDTIQKTIQEWEKIHNPKNRGVPEDIPSFSFAKEISLLEALKSTGMFASSSEIKRLLKQKGVHLIQNHQEERVIEDPKFLLSQGEYLFRIGKRRFIRFLLHKAG